MSSETNHSSPVNGSEQSGSEANGWPDRREKSAEWWGERHPVPRPGDPERLRMFAQPVEISEEEQSQILSNWRKITEGYPQTRAMNPELRPSTPRHIRADNRIQKLRDEGVDVDPQMEVQIRNVIENNSGLHEALRHYTEGESNELIPYMNELLHREDRMLFEWARQRKADYDWYETHLRGEAGPQGDLTSNDEPPQEDTAAKQDISLAVSADTNSQGGEGSSKATDGTPSKASNINKDRAPSQLRSPTSPRARTGLAQAQTVSDAERQSVEDERIKMILNLEAQIATLDRSLRNLDPNAGEASSTSYPLRRNYKKEDSFDRVFELLRTVLEEKQRRLCTLNKKRSKTITANRPNGQHAAPSSSSRSVYLGAIQSGPQGGSFLGVFRKAWNRCVDGPGSSETCQGGSQADPRERSIELRVSNRQTQTSTTDLRAGLFGQKDDDGVAYVQQ